jgi:subtilisin family serine protease
MLITGADVAGATFVVVRIGLAFVLALIVAPLAILTENPILRAIYRTWLAAILFLALCAPLQALPISWAQPASLAQMLLGALGTGALLIWRRMRRLPLARAPIAPGLGLGALLLLPWLLYGALGSWLDTLLALGAAAAFGVFAALLLETLLLPALRAPQITAVARIALGGLAASITLLILLAGLGFGGSELLLLFFLPPLGFVAVALMQPDAPAPAAALLAAALAGALVSFDQDELLLIIGFSDIPRWAMQATGISLLIGLALAVAAIALTGRLRRGPAPRVAIGLAVGAWLVALLAYAAAGQPGFHGERLFVIMREQAVLQPVSGDHAARTTAVYTALTSHAEQTQANLREALDRFGVRYTPYYLVNALEVEGGPFVRMLLAAHPDVDRVIDSPQLRPLPEPLPLERGSAEAPGAPAWNITSIGADRVWREFEVTGAGIVIGQSDSGVEGDHPALADGYRGRDGEDDYNWLDPWSGTTSPRDLGGHGTHTLGSVLGRGGIGVAPGAEWFACANLERNLGNPALYLDCMQFMLAPYPQGGDPLRDGDPARAAHVLNNSWGCPPIEGCDAEALRPAAEALRAAGIFVVVSAGNEGPRCSSVSSPLALYDAVFSVGAIDSMGNLAEFSSRGPVEVDGSGRIKPDIVAPGVEVLSALPGGTYGANSGTSMAGPHVAGVVALMWSANPELIGDIDRTEEILISTARRYAGSEVGCFDTGRPSNAYGYGVVDAYAAVRAAIADSR